MTYPPPTDAFSYFKYFIKPGLRGFFFFFLVTFSFLLVLGTWQLDRLAWKNQLIQEINTNASKGPVSLESLMIEALSQDKNPDYRRVYIQGTFEIKNSFKLLAQTHKDTLGYHLIVPFALGNGAHILINIGFVPAHIDPKDIALPKGSLELNGIVSSKTGRTSYTPPNNYKTGDLFNIDPLEVASEKTWPALLPFFVTLTAPLSDSMKYPLLIKRQIAIRNAHLGYALTWYLLALFWLILFVVYARRKI